jgi:hypothetical protein
VLNDIGLEARMSAWMHKFMQPLARVLLPSATAGHPLDHHHSFIVQYKEVRHVWDNVFSYCFVDHVIGRLLIDMNLVFLGATESSNSGCTIRETLLNATQSFMSHPRQGADISLDMHTDDSDVTFNVNVCDAFEGAGLSFCGLYGNMDRRILNHVRSSAADAKFIQCFFFLNQSTEC